MATDVPEQMRGNPRDWRIGDVIRICRQAGVTCTPPRNGSQMQGEARASPDISTISAHRPIKPAYGRKLVRFIDAVQGSCAVNPQDYEVGIRPLRAADGGFTAIAPGLPGCRSDGETSEKALTDAYDAIGCRIEAATEMGRRVPEPRCAAA